MVEAYPWIVLAGGRMAATAARVGRWGVRRAFELAEVGFVVLALAGFALLVNVPAAMLAGGVLGVVAVERASSHGQGGTVHRLQARDRDRRARAAA